MNGCRLCLWQPGGTLGAIRADHGSSGMSRAVNTVFTDIDHRQ
jgi:hypothetical protein